MTVLVATFETTGNGVSIGIDPQARGVTANDGSTKTYTVTVGAAPLAPTGLTTSNVTNTSIAYCHPAWRWD